MKGVRALVIAVALFSAFATVASAENGVLVTINGSDNPFLLSQRTVSDAQDVSTEEEQTVTRRADGGESTDPHPGTKLATVLELAGLPRAIVDSVTIKRVSLTGYVTIDAQHLVGGFHGERDGITRYAVINTGYGHGVGFFRPVDSTQDVNGTDSMTTYNDLDLPVSVSTRNTQVRTVVARVEDDTLDSGGVARFSAEVTNAPAGVTFDYTWDFGDGTTARGDRPPDHLYRDGPYNVTVTAVGSDESAGVSKPIHIQVGEPISATPTPTPPAAETPVPTPAGGSGGGERGPTGGGAGEKQSRTSGPKRSKGTGERKTRGSKQSKADPAATATPSATVTPTATPTAATPTPTAPPSDTKPGAAEPAQTATPVPERPAPGGERVEGILLANAGSIEDAIQAARSVPSSPREQDRSQARSGGGGGASIAGWVGGSSGLIALLALGAVREAGVRRRVPLT